MLVVTHGEVFSRIHSFLPMAPLVDIHEADAGNEDIALRVPKVLLCVAPPVGTVTIANPRSGSIPEGYGAYGTCCSLMRITRWSWGDLLERS